jgi:RNA polymerase sigma-70 factor (ECF subfamily)
VLERAPRFEPGARQQREVLRAFGEACASGELGRLVAVLDEDVVCRTDGGGRRLAARRPIRGLDRVSRFLMGLLRKQPNTTARPVRVNGGHGLVVLVDGDPYGVLSCTVAGGRITELDLVVNPEKLRHLSLGGGHGAEAL